VTKILPATLIVLLCLACSKAPAESAATAQPGAGAPAAASASPATPEPGTAAGETASNGHQAGQVAGQQDDQEAVKPVPEKLPEVLARVNGETITREEFQRAVSNVERNAGQPVPAEHRDRVYRGILDQMISMRVLMQEARTRNVTVTDAELDEHIGRLRQQFPSEDQFTQALAERKMTLEQLREDARRDLTLAKMVDAEVKPKIKIEEREVKAFYDENPAQFQQPETFRASHILVPVPPNATEEQKQAARAEIEGILKDIRGGADFAEMARKHSKDGSAANGGDLGTFPRGQMVAPFEEALVKLSPGEVSGVVETQFGYHVIKLAEKNQGRTVPLAEVSSRIGQFLTMRAQQEQAGEFIKVLRAKSKIEVLI
jgi:peptidyl-prolyl cis-trans isomerase C